MDFARDFDVFGNEHFSYITFQVGALQIYISAIKRFQSW